MPARFFIGNGPNLYGKYLTGTTNWAQTTSNDDLADIYPAGYLPYSGDINDPRDMFYLSRSLRVACGGFSLKKKRRYDHREWARFGLTRELVDKETFLARQGANLMKHARDWMEPRFGNASLPQERLEYILCKRFLRHIMVWRDGDEMVAFALVVAGVWGAHYWYVFYKNGGDSQSAPGHGFLVDFLAWCQSEKLPYAYLGTAYARKSRYKSRGIRGTEFWDGSKWSPDMDELGQLQDQDETLTARAGLTGP